MNGSETNILTQYWWLILLALTPKILDLIIGKGKKKSTRKKSGINYERYGLRRSILTKNELKFYESLKSIVKDKYTICAKVKLSDIFYIKNGRGYYAALGRVNQKHVDFLLCYPKSLKPFMGIEVDDKSHQRSDRKKRDKFVNKLFETKKLPLLRFSAKMEYNTEEITSEIKKILSSKDE